MAIWWRGLSLAEQIIACLALAGIIWLVLAAASPAAEIPPARDGYLLWYAVIIAAPGVVLPVFLAVFNARAARKEKEREWKRQDQLEERHSAEARAIADAADHATKNVKMMAAEAARLLEENNRLVATGTEKTHETLVQITEGQKEIHTLVNSKVTALIEQAHAANVLALASKIELIDVKKKQGEAASLDDLAEVAAIRAKIAELATTMVDRGTAAAMARPEADDAHGHSGTT